jgi:hypothetical protein
MALFRQSTIPWATAVQQIADSVGASGDAEMLNRAHMALRAAFQAIGGRARWDFLRGEYPVQTVTGPFSLGTVSATAGSAYAGVSASHGIAVDDIVSGTAFAYGTRVSATASTGFGFTVVAVTGGVLTATFTRDMYDAPPDMRSEYGVKLLSSQRPLIYVTRRPYDRSQTDEFTASTPYWYDLFMLGSASKVRLLPPPAGADLLFQRYYRAFTTPTASGASGAIDIPVDYEFLPIAWAKWHFMVDKGEGRKDQASTWMSLAQDGLKQMLAEQTTIPDSDLTMTPGHLPFWTDSRSTRWLNWDFT